MAIIRSLAIGKARKSAGNLTFATIQGRTIAREKPAFVKNPKTQKQLAQRGKMAKCVAAYRSFGVLTRKYFTVLKKYNSQYNAFVSANIDIADNFEIVESSGDVTNVVGCVVSNGNFKTSQPYPLSTDQGGSILWSLKLTSGEVAVEGDIIALIGWDEVSKDYVYREHPLVGSDIEDLNDGKVINDESVFEGSTLASGALIYYSPSRNLSSYSVVQELADES